MSYVISFEVYEVPEELYLYNVVHDNVLTFKRILSDHFNTCQILWVH